MNQKNHAFIAIGLMLFALFFGAGNLIFPPYIGQQAGTNILPAMIGFLITGGGLPLIAVVAVCYSGKDLRDITSRVHPWYGVFMVAAISLTIGPFFAIPRTCSTSFEMSVVPMLGEGASSGWAQFLYSALFFLVSWRLAVKPSRLVAYIGKILTPMILILLAALFVCYLAAPLGSWQAPAEARFADGFTAFTTGILEGYNTMDGLAGLLFGILVTAAVKAEGITDERRIAWETFRSGIVAIFCLCVIYVFLGCIGASSVLPVGMQENGAPILVAVMGYYFGAAGPLMLAAVVLLACLTTSIGLIAAVGSLWNQLLPGISFKIFATLFSLISLGIANFGLTAIIAGAIPVLVFLYPLTVALIILTFLNDAYKGSPVVHRTATLFTAFPALYDGLHALKLTPPALDAFMKSLPLAQHGLAWLPIFGVGLLVGVVIWKLGKREEEELEVRSEE